MCSIAKNTVQEQFAIVLKERGRSGGLFQKLLVRVLYNEYPNESIFLQQVRLNISWHNIFDASVLGYAMAVTLQYRTVPQVPNGQKCCVTIGYCVSHPKQLTTFIQKKKNLSTQLF